MNITANVTVELEAINKRNRWFRVVHNDTCIGLLAYVGPNASTVEFESNMGKYRLYVAEFADQAIRQMMTEEGLLVNA
jgi:hypothetical protein